MSNMDTHHLPIILVEYPACFNNSGNRISFGEIPPSIFCGVYAKENNVINDATYMLYKTTIRLVVSVHNNYYL